MTKHGLFGWRQVKLTGKGSQMIVYSLGVTREAIREGARGKRGGIPKREGVAIGGRTNGVESATAAAAAAKHTHYKRLVLVDIQRFQSYFFVCFLRNSCQTKHSCNGRGTPLLL